MEKDAKRSRTRRPKNLLGLEIDDSHWISKRLEKSRRVSDDLFDIKAKPCISGKDSKNFISKFLDFKTIGQGSYGRVVRGITKSSDVVVMKEAYLKDPNVTSQEDYISNLLNKLLTTKKCPNFIYTFFVSKCQSCNVKTLFSKKKFVSESPCYIMFMESADVDLHDYSDRASTFKLQSSILYQVLFAVYAAHHYYGIFHGDIKTENILLQKVVPGGYFKYQIGNESYYVKNDGVVAYLADFGVAEILSRKFVMPRSYFYGSRNAVVDSVARKWLPIYIPGNYVVKWKTSEGPPILGTENEIMGEEESSTLEETVEEMYPEYDNFQMNEDDAPPFEFYNDIQDVLRMFVGGKRTVQPGLHNSLPNNLEMTTLLKKIKAVVKYEQIFSSLYTLKYVLARYMIDELYREDPRSPKNHPNNVIATFKM